ncbi:MAG TPA: choice-of-anchor D domain-containing protein, partial [Polyangiaceae bacterium]
MRPSHRFALPRLLAVSALSALGGCSIDSRTFESNDGSIAGGDETTSDASVTVTDTGAVGLRDVAAPMPDAPVCAADTPGCGASPEGGTRIDGARLDAATGEGGASDGGGDDGRASEGGTPRDAQAPTDAGMEAAPLPPSIAISPRSSNYGQVVIGQFAELSFQISNQGNLAASTPLVTLGGTDAASFSISANTCITAIPGGGMCSVMVRFSPTAICPKSASVTATATQGGSASATLSGIGKLATGTVVEFTVPANEDFALIGLTVGADNNLWFSQDDFFRMNTSGQLLSPPLAAPDGLSGGWLATGPDGNVWAPMNITLATGEVGTISPAGAMQPPVPLNAFPFTIAKGPDNNMWVTLSTPDAIARIIVSTGSENRSVTIFPILTGNVDPAFITAGPDQALWFTEFTGNRIGRISTAGDISEQPVPTPASNPDGITLGPDGNIWFTERAANKIGVRSLATSVITEITIPTALPTGGIGPIGIAAGPDGAV